MNACSRWRLYDCALAASWFYVKQLLILLNSKVPSFAAAWRTFLRKKTKRCPFHSSIFPKLKEPNSIFKCIKKFTWYKKGVFATIYYFWNIFLRISQHLIKPTPIRSHQRWCSGTSAPSMAFLITLLFILHTAHKIITCFLREQQGNSRATCTNRGMSSTETRFLTLRQQATGTPGPLAQDVTSCGHSVPFPVQVAAYNRRERKGQTGGPPVE